MSAVFLKEKREKLFGEIATIMETWPEQQRQVFIQAHYNGKSPSAISRTMAVDVEEIRSILDKCERQLHRSLRGFHENRRGDTSAASTDPGGCPRLQTPPSFRAHAAC